MISFIIAWKERPQQIQLCHNSAASKDVDGRVVVGATQQNLRSAVPSGADIVSERRPGPDFSCQSEVSDFNGVALDQQILGLHVSVEKAVLVHVRQSENCLVHNALDLLLGKPFVSIFHKLVNILLHELKYKV